MTDKLTPTQTLLMWGLLAKQGSAAQADLEPEVKAADRKALESLKLILSQKVNRKLFLSLTDGGWAWAAEHLRDDLPANYGTLRDLMSRLDKHLKIARKTLGDFIGTPSETAVEEALRLEKERKAAEAEAKAAAKAAKAGETAMKKARAVAEKKTRAKDDKAPAAKNGVIAKKTESSASAKNPPAKRKASTSKAKPSLTLSDPTDVRVAIERAYLSVTGGRKGVEARLSDVRPHLAHLDRTVVDEALAAIRRSDKKARLLRIDEQRSITPADIAAALPFAGESLHILWIMK